MLHVGANHLSRELSGNANGNRSCIYGLSIRADEPGFLLSLRVRLRAPVPASECGLQEKSRTEIIGGYEDRSQRSPHRSKARHQVTRTTNYLAKDS